jgi:hypothetical protein
MRLEQPVPRPPFQPPHREPLPEIDDEPAVPAAPEKWSKPTVSAGRTLPVTEVVAPAASADPPTAIAPAPVELEAPIPTDDFGAGLAEADPGEKKDV